MKVDDPAAEYLRLAEHYRQMKDEELLVLVPQSSELTPLAEQALANEVRQRGLKVEAATEEPAAPPSKPALRFNAPSPRFRGGAAESSASAGRLYADRSNAVRSNGDEPDEEDPYEEERKLLTLCTVWSQRDALKVQWILDVAGIPFYMGPQKATGVDRVRSDFSKGVAVQIMQVGWPWAYQAMKGRYFPQDDPPSEMPQEPKDLVIGCPQCRSTEVVFNGLSKTAGAPDDTSSRRFRWTCEACGNEWEDDGVAKEE
jgi:DNA-directed RNA polymerase subunit M/transcription elongation factor TFIIS